MAKKYIDLASRISNESGAYHLRDTIIEGVLEWLDDHTEQVPGRTITESELKDLSHDYYSSGRSVDAIISRLGITVVPDPEPTNAEKLEIALKTHFGPGAFTVEGGSLSRFLDGIGVTAPGGDDDH